MGSYTPPLIVLGFVTSFWLIFGSGCEGDFTPSAESSRNSESSPLLPQIESLDSLGLESHSNSTLEVEPRFQDVADELGLFFTFHTDLKPGRFFLPEVMGGGIGCIDFDRDGLFDLFFPNGSFLAPEDATNKIPPANAFFRNRGVGFRNVASEAGLEHRGYGQGCAVADYDADGFPDLFLTNYGENVLYRNNGDGTFTPADPRTIRGTRHWSTSCAWVDLNLDGLIDLYVVNYLDVRPENVHACDYDGVEGYCGPGEYQALSDEAFLNLGDGTFEEASQSLGLVAEEGKGLAVSVLDFDYDLKPEIYVANDMTENFLFSRTDPTGVKTGDHYSYQNIARLAGCAVSESGMHEASMGVACADFDFDLRPDIFLTHYYQHKNTLYRNRGQMSFSDDSRRFRVVTTSRDFLGFGVVPFDYDSNGSTDLFIANGHVIGPNYPVSMMPPQLLSNIDGRYFEDISDQAGAYFDRLTLGRGATGIDFDNDGDTDLAVSHLSHPASLLENETLEAGYRVIGLILEDRHRQCPIGGRVEIECLDYHRVYPIISGGSYLSCPDPRLRIPLPKEFESDATVRVHWPSGEISEYRNLSPGYYWYVRERQEPISLLSFSLGTGRVDIKFDEP